MNIAQTIKDTIREPSLADLAARRDEARRKQLDARAAYAEAPTEKTLTAMDKADAAYEETERHVRAREALEAKRKREAEEARRTQLRADYAKHKAVALGFAQTIDPHVQWFVETSREARKRHAQMLDARQKQHLAVHAMTAIARELGLPDETPAIAHGGTIAGTIGRAIQRDINASGESMQETAGLDTHDLFRPVKG